MSEDRIKELEKEIQRHREAYYNNPEGSEISDKEYDALEAELRFLDPENEILKQVGAETPVKTKWEKRLHTIPMGSLNKANSVQEVRAWHSKTGQGQLYWSEKMDGISIALRYQKGELVEALTRGDGQVGEDILANVVLMRGAPRRLEKPVTGVFRGEIVLTHDFFAQKFPDMSNPRNAASGMAKTEDRKRASRCEYLTIYVYEAFVEGNEFRNESEKYLYIDSLGFYLPSHGGPITPDEVEQLYQKYEAGFRGEIGYDIDGLVIRQYEQRRYEALGQRNNRPFGAVALKFEAEAQSTILREIVWQVGNTGRLTPVAVFDPVMLAGAMVTRSSLYNASYIKEKGLSEGDLILVQRANDVIPRVEDVIEKRSGELYAQIPKKCPECESFVVEEGEYLICPEASCPARLRGNIKTWVRAQGLLEWGDGIIESLVSQGKVKTLAHLYEIKPEEMASIENEGGARLGKKVATRLVETLHQKKEITLDMFVEGLNIPMTGGATIRLLMKAGFNTLEALQLASQEDLQKPKGMGERKAAALYQGLRERERVIEGLLKYVSINTASGPLEGLSFCLTGSMSKSRKVVEKIIKDAGGEIRSGVSSKLSFLVCNDKKSTSSKARRAREIGTPIIDEDTLYGMVGQEED